MDRQAVDMSYVIEIKVNWWRRVIKDDYQLLH